jgi:recombination protein RecA
MNVDVISRLKNAGLLSEQVQSYGFVSTGSYALNKVISGDYFGGIPVGYITQFFGEASTAKTVFATHILKDAQSKGYYSMLVDSENAYNSDFARKLGLDPEKLIYAAPDTLEDCFQVIEDTIKTIRETDPDTPIVVAYDSIAVSPAKAEFEDSSYEGNNMEGAIRAKTAGKCLRKINPLIRKYKVGLVVINQTRSKVGVMYGDPTTTAGGGKALEFYLGVNLKTISNKTSDLIKDANKNVVGIQGKVRNTKNKVALPFRECEFELRYDTGLNPYYGIIPALKEDGVITQGGAWYTVVENEFKFQSKDFEMLLQDPEIEQMEPLRKLLGISLENVG